MSVNLKERYVIDETGNRVAVLLDIEEYQRILGALEELESINAYDEAKAANDEIIPIPIFQSKPSGAMIGSIARPAIPAKLLRKRKPAISVSLEVELLNC